MNTTGFQLDEPRFRLQLQSMLVMQDAMNACGDKDWKRGNYPWHRALYAEAGEFLEHMATWKWWQKGTANVPLANMELIDMWHAALSWYILRFGQPVNSDTLVTAILLRVREAVKGLPSPEVLRAAGDETRYEILDRLVAKAADGLFDTKSYIELLAYCGMDLDSLYAGYVGKNALNQFRVANGYAEGRYVKVWDGKEDNVHLMELLADTPADENLPNVVYAGLSKRYCTLFAHAPMQQDSAMLDVAGRPFGIERDVAGRPMMA